MSETPDPPHPKPRTFDGAPDWKIDLGAPEKVFDSVLQNRITQALSMAATERAARPHDERAMEALRAVVRRAHRAGIEESRIAVAGRLSLEAVQAITAS